jgi:hypothetical protein
MDDKTKRLIEAAEGKNPFPHKFQNRPEVITRQLAAAVREQDKRARHAEQERDAFDKRIAELEAEQAASWSAFEKEALDAIGSEVIGMITDAGSDIPGMIKKLHAHYANKLRIMDERRLEAESRRIKAEEQRDSYKRIASIKKPTASPAQE